MFKCPNCNGSLVFDIKTQALRCLHCGSTMNVEDYHKTNNADTGTDAYGVMVSLCPNCGAEIISPDTAVTGFCSYCGSEVVMQERMDEEKRPKYVIPFQITKEECRKQFKQKVHAPYVPSEFKNDAFLEGFRGIYIPYWMYQIEYSNRATVPAIKTYTKGNYEYTDRYSVSVQMDGDTYGVPYDASQSFDDQIAEELAPFNKDNMKLFQEEYLAGFYADRANVSAEEYKEEAVTKAAENLLDRVDATLEKGMETNRESMKTVIRQIGATIESFDSVLFPVWFLTWRNKNRVAYAIMNGQTGKVAFTMPVDLKKMFAGIAVVSVGVFFLLNSFLAVTARVALGLISCISAFVAILINMEAGNIYKREFHLEDKGYGNKIKGKKIDTDKSLDFSGVALIVIAIFWEWLTDWETLLWVGIGATIFCIIAFLFIKEFADAIKDKSLPASAILLIAVNILVVLMFLFNPVSDIYYYGAAIAVLVAVLIACFVLVQHYNMIATRPIPTFTDRKGGDNSAKDY